MSCPILRKSFCVSPSAGAVRLQRKSLVLHDRVSSIITDIYNRRYLRNLCNYELIVASKSEYIFRIYQSSYTPVSYGTINVSRLIILSPIVRRDAADVARAWQIDRESMIPFQRIESIVVILPNYVRAS